MVTGDTIKKIRTLRGFTQEYMADKLNISQRAYSYLENDQSKLDVDRVKQLAEVFEIDPIQLLAFDEKQIFNYGHQAGNNGTLHGTFNNFSGYEKEQYEQKITELMEQNAELMKEIEKLKKR